MKVNAFFCEWEENQYCVTYPVEITNEHPVCSYGQYVVIIDGEPLGPGEMPPGELQISKEVYDQLADKLKEQGYLVCGSPVDEDWLKCWDKGMPIKDHWHSEARLVSF